MLAINWNDPETYWLNITNIWLGVVVLICLIVVAFSVVQEFRARSRKRATERDLDREVKDLVANYTGANALDIPGLGLTMADGGEPLQPPARERNP
jgi:hypothetical protein